MKASNFLNKLKKEDSLKLVEPSEDISKSYLIKSEKCIKVAELAYNAGIYENAISEAYYSIYNSVLSLFYKCGIKCENHAGSILLLTLLFGEEELFKIISDAKKERIDKQYYVTTEKDDITKEIAVELLNNAEDFVLKMKVVVKKLNNDLIDELRNKFETI